MVNEIKGNKTWDKQSQTLKKVQLQFEFINDVDRQIKIDAADQSTTPSNIIRDLLGLKPSGRVRPRVGVSFAPDEMVKLAERFSIDPGDNRAIVRKATEAIHAHYEKRKDST